jgi:Tyrosyl-DNA phosphodiesterase
MPSAAHFTALHAGHSLQCQMLVFSFVHRGKELAWALVASHNLSKAAWGALQVHPMLVLPCGTMVCGKGLEQSLPTYTLFICGVAGQRQQVAHPALRAGCAGAALAGGALPALAAVRLLCIATPAWIRC